jgi:hypothetical protein
VGGLAPLWVLREVLKGWRIKVGGQVMTYRAVKFFEDQPGSKATWCVTRDVE